MMKEMTHIDTPAVGCLIGSAFQKLLGQLADDLKREGLDITPSEYMIMRAVYSKQGLQQCEIAEMVGKDKASICRTVATLDKKGLVRTESVSHKCLRVYLTDYAVEIEPSIRRVAESRHRALVELVGEENVVIVTSILNKILINS